MAKNDSAVNEVSGLSDGVQDDVDAIAVQTAEFAPLTAGGQRSNGNNIELLLDVVLRVTVELGRAKMPIRDVLALGPGSVVELEKLAGEPVDVYVNNTLIARGEVVVVDEKFGVRITDVVSKAKRVVSLG